METMMKACNSSKVANNANASIEAHINAYGPVPDYKAFTDYVVNQLKDKTNKLYKGILIDEAKIVEIIYSIPVVRLKLHNEIMGYIEDNGLKFPTQVSKTYIGINAFINILRQNKDVNINEIIDNPKVLENILTGATIDILQIPIYGGDTLISPFTNKEILLGKDVIFNVITDIHLNK